MNIVITRLKGKGARSYDDFDFTFDDSIVTQLIGKNGAGKSAIPVILEEVLYNNNSRGVKKANMKNRYLNDKSWSAEVHFTIDNNKYVVSKVVASTAKVTLTQNGVDISGHTATQTYGIIKELFGGIDFKTFSKLVYQSIKSSMDFLEASDANRRKFLVSLLGLEEYSGIEARVKEAYKTATANLGALHTSFKTIQKVIDTTKIPDSMELVEVPEYNVEELSTSLKEVEFQLKDSDRINKEIQEYEKSVIEYKRKSGKLKEEIDSLIDSIALSKEYIALHDSEDVTDELNSILRKLEVVESQMSSNKAMYQKMKTASEVTSCPTCGSELDVAEQVRAMNIAKDAFVKQKPERDTLRQMADEFKQKQTQHKETTKVRNKLVTLTRDLEYKENFDIEPPSPPATRCKTDTNFLKDSIATIKAELDRCKTDVLLAERQNAKALATNEARELAIASIETAKTELQSLEVRLSELNTEVGELEVLIKVFGSKGLIAYKIENSIKAFEGLINKYLSELADGKFALAFEIEESKLKVKLYDNGHLVDMPDLSSGEQGKVTISTLLAIRAMMSSISKTHINLLFLDEVISVLDEEALNTLVDVLSRETSLNTVLVSHGFSHPATKDIFITKENNISKVS